MASLYVESYTRGTITDRAGNPLPIAGMVQQKQKINIASAANSGTAIPDITKFVVLTADTACQVEIGEDPTATAGSMYLPSDTPRYYSVRGGHKISVMTKK